jgi:hypothetical protein
MKTLIATLVVLVVSAFAWYSYGKTQPHYYCEGEPNIKYLVLPQGKTCHPIENPADFFALEPKLVEVQKEICDPVPDSNIQDCRTEKKMVMRDDPVKKATKLKEIEDKKVEAAKKETDCAAMKEALSTLPSIVQYLQKCK